MEQYISSSNIKKGIENALILNGINIDEYFEEKKKDTGYGKVNTEYKLQKVKLCTDICNLDKNKLKTILQYLKETLLKIQNNVQFYMND